MSLFDQFSAFIGYPSRVQLDDGTSTDGVLYCIDPETDHVALLCPSGHEVSSYSVKIVLAHNVRGIKKMLHESSDLPTLVALEEELKKDEKRNCLNDTGSIQRRREKLGQFLTKNFVSYEMVTDGRIRVFGGAATVREPFHTVECANEQLLRQMQQLLNQFNQHQHDAFPSLV
ncbi:hypothetical protein DD238_006020 [Peronospora effusa]|uniref:Gem-associated protein 6 n=1 Tax=Peronospora effusa TaxID=542832 RepID=A0A3M6VFL3_9STRA|nr:hypothetical protein DD238_006020 [Peronospora effusa]